MINKCIEPCSTHGICVPLDNFDFSLSASNTNSTPKIAWNELASAKRKIILVIMYKMFVFCLRKSVFFGYLILTHLLEISGNTVHYRSSCRLERTSVLFC